MSTLDDFQKRISTLESEVAKLKAKVEELSHVEVPTITAPVSVPTETAVEEAVEEAHVEVKPAEEEAEEESTEEETSEEE